MHKYIDRKKLKVKTRKLKLWYALGRKEKNKDGCLRMKGSLIEKLERFRHLWFTFQKNDNKKYIQQVKQNAMASWKQQKSVNSVGILGWECLCSTA